MQLIEFTRANDNATAVWINPDAVRFVEPVNEDSHAQTRIHFGVDTMVSVRESLFKVIAELTD